MAVLIPLLCIAAYITAWELEAILYVPDIQAALDEQCGQGVVIANRIGYDGDPAPSYWSREATCYQDLDRQFVCNCDLARLYSSVYQILPSNLMMKLSRATCKKLEIVIPLVVVAMGAILGTMVAEGQYNDEPEAEIWRPEPGTTWQWQLNGDINTSWNVDMYDIDLFDAPQEIIDTLRTDGRVIICYVSAGSWENWRDDADDFPDEILGSTLEGWHDERWLDIRQIDLLEPIISARLDLAVEKGCNGVEPDNIDGWANDTGFPLTYDDQIAFNIWLAEMAHQRGLSIGLKNDLDQIEDLVEHFDWALNEQCFQYEECDLLLPFIETGKAVFGVEYEGYAEEYCPLANELGFSWLTKSLDLDDEPPSGCWEMAQTTEFSMVDQGDRKE
jgi:hypothetical protein